jgi:hypothetical protein
MPLDAIYNYTKIFVSEFGFTEGDDNIMAEIYARGPVSIYLNADCLTNYTSGVNMYDTCKPNIPNHVVQINGWGSENGADYWIGRCTHRAAVHINHFNLIIFWCRSQQLGNLLG